MWLIYLKVFLAGGFLCLIGQIILIKTKIAPTYILVSFLIFGVFLEAIGVFEPLAELFKAGVQVPIMGFGAALARGVIEEVQQSGLIGAFTGGLKATAGGIAAAIFFSYLVALFFNSKSKKS